MMKVLIAIGVLLGALAISRLIGRLLTEFGNKRQISARRIYTVRKVSNFLLGALGLMLFCAALGLGYHQVYIFLGSVLAVIGIALFAQWSILSHLTSGIIIFFAFPYRVGDKVKVVDADEDISGEIIEIASFHVLIRREDGATITYPNTALLQKPVIKQPPSSRQLSQKAEMGEENPLQAG